MVTNATICFMDSTTIRRRNITMLVRLADGPTAFSKLVDRDQVQVSQWTSETKPKPIGNKLARSIEQRLGKEAGWLDRPQWPDEPGNPHVSVNEIGATYALPARMKRVPVRGSVIVGSNGFWVDTEDLSSACVEFSSAAAGAYALRVKGTGLSPAVRHGSVLIAVPSAALRPGEYVLLVLKDGRSSVFVFQRLQQGEYMLQDAVTDKPVTFDEGAVESAHYVASIVGASNVIEDGA